MDIYKILFSLNNNQHYLNRYIKLIIALKDKNVNLKKGHEHHICPESLFPEYSNFSKNKWNKLLVTYDQHLVLHHVLARAYEGKMSQALWSMVNGKNSNQSNKISLRLYREAMEKHSIEQSERMKAWWTPERRKELSEKWSGEGNPFYGHKHTEETKNTIREFFKGSVLSEEIKRKISNTLQAKQRKLTDEQKDSIRIRQTGETNSFYGKRHSEESKLKISNSNKGRTSPLKGKNITEETKEKISKSLSGRELTQDHKNKIGDLHRGKTVSEETKAKLSASKMGIPSKKKGIEDISVVCPHCGKIGGRSIMKRWHFDNCKYSGSPLTILDSDNCPFTI